MAANRPAIALNAQLLRLGPGYRSAGIARYIYNLLRELPAAAPDLELHAFTGDPLARRTFTGLRLHPTRWPTGSAFPRILWEQSAWPVDLVRGRFSLAHSLAFVSPLLNPYPSIVTVYDLSFILYPGYFRPFNRLYLNWGVRSSAARARRVIAISEATRRDLVRLLGVEEDKIDVALPGIDPAFSSAASEDETRTVEEFRRSKNLPEHFLLYVGTLEPRKNIPALIRAFMRAKTSGRIAHHLVLAGGRGWKDEPVLRALEETGADRAVRLAGYAAQEELPLWYRAADAFVYPSLYEGFGMPPLEAMASGTPVITSSISSLKEAVGDAALLVDPRDEQALEDAIVRMLNEASLRLELAARGQARSRAFSWSRTARATADVYRRALGVPVPSAAREPN